MNWKSSSFVLVMGCCIDLTRRVNTGLRRSYFLIATFRDDDTERLFRGGVARRLPANIQKVALRKLTMLNAAEELVDLLAPPSNRLERLRGDRNGQHSIRVNDQWRVCFRWHNGHAYDVEIVDYH